MKQKALVWIGVGLLALLCVTLATLHQTPTKSLYFVDTRSSATMTVRYGLFMNELEREFHCGKAVLSITQHHPQAEELFWDTVYKQSESNWMLVHGHNNQFIGKTRISGSFARPYSKWLELFCEHNWEACDSADAAITQLKHLLPIESE